MLAVITVVFLCVIVLTVRVYPSRPRRGFAVKSEMFQNPPQQIMSSRVNPPNCTTVGCNNMRSSDDVEADADAISTQVRPAVIGTGTIDGALVANNIVVGEDDLQQHLADQARTNTLVSQTLPTKLQQIDRRITDETGRLRPSTLPNVTDWGHAYTPEHRGYYDLYKAKKCHDYCRWVGANENGGDPMTSIDSKVNQRWSCHRGIDGATSTQTDYSTAGWNTVNTPRNSKCQLAVASVSFGPGVVRCGDGFVALVHYQLPDDFARLERITVKGKIKGHDSQVANSEIRLHFEKQPYLSRGVQRCTRALSTSPRPDRYVHTTPQVNPQLASLWKYQQSGSNHAHKEFATELTRFEKIEHLVAKDVVVLSCNPGPDNSWATDVDNLELRIMYWKHPHPNN